MSLLQPIKDVKQLNGLALAYIGDAVYELYVRHHLLSNGNVKPHQLHKQAIQYVSAKAQAKVLLTLLENELLTEEEQSVVRREETPNLVRFPKTRMCRRTDIVQHLKRLLAIIF